MPKTFNIDETIVIDGTLPGTVTLPLEIPIVATLAYEFGAITITGVTPGVVPYRIVRTLAGETVRTTSGEEIRVRR